VYLGLSALVGRQPAFLYDAASRICKEPRYRRASALLRLQSDQGFGMSQHPKYPLAGRARHQSRARNARFSVELNSPGPMLGLAMRAPARLEVSGA
jgi:hypothetical protein